jgi:hypothetical protein
MPMKTRSQDIVRKIALHAIIDLNHHATSINNGFAFYLLEVLPGTNSCAPGLGLT